MRADDIIGDAVDHCRSVGWMKTAAKLEDITSAPHYCEPGYKLEKGKTCVLFGNWNTNYYPKYDAGVTQDQIDEDAFYKETCDKLDQIAELEWHDEWQVCDDCGGAFRISPDGHGWQKSYHVLGVECLCHKCLKGQEETVLEDLEGNTRQCLPGGLNIDPAKFGYVKLEMEFERGLHHGQAADPKIIGTMLEARGITRYVFAMEQASQFYVTFAVWVHSEQAGKMPNPDDLTNSDVNSPVSPAQNAEAALRSMPIATGPGVHVSSINCDTGEVSHRNVSPADFVAGLALK